MSLAKKLLSVQPAAGGGAFNPETDVTWHSLFWAEGTDFKALGLADAASVTTWPNETGEQDATATGTPLYDEVSNLNSQPAVLFDGTGDYFRTAAFTTGPDYTSGVSIVAVTKTANTTANQTYFDGSDPTSADRNAVKGQASGTVWRLNAGNNQDAGGWDTSAHLLVAQFDGGSGNESLAVDGAVVIDGSAGPKGLVGLSIGVQYNDGASLDGEIALLGIYEGGDITADASWPDFKT
jgi:hypothetical protein